jgi:hypothetical protein
MALNSEGFIAKKQNAASCDAAFSFRCGPSMLTLVYIFSPKRHAG